MSAFGDLDFDLRNATMDTGQAEVTVLAAFGNVDIYVPEGVNVDVGGLTVLGHCRDWGRDAGQPDAPSIHVRVLGFSGTIDVWRVPRDLREGSYRQILRTLNEAGVRCPASLQPGAGHVLERRWRAPDMTTPPGACAHEGAPWPVRRSPHGERRNMAPAGRYSMKAVS